MLSICTCTF
uniref:Uncharacterized protein n=1 Tax=Rhizophora mucronata TaxID=61149 RepID=A0A2P2IYD0_RHIMU